MRYRLLVLALTLLLGSSAPIVDAEPGGTTPSAREVAEKMEPCVGQAFLIAEPGAHLNPNGDPVPVQVTTPAGAFGIKEIAVTRFSDFATVMFSRNPRQSLLYLTFPEQVGNGYVNLDPADDFQHRVVDCFYGSYIGQDVIK